MPIQYMNLESCARAYWTIFEDICRNAIFKKMYVATKFREKLIVNENWIFVSQYLPIFLRIDVCQAGQGQLYIVFTWSLASLGDTGGITKEDFFSKIKTGNNFGPRAQSHWKGHSWTQKSKRFIYCNDDFFLLTVDGVSYSELLKQLLRWKLICCSEICFQVFMLRIIVYRHACTASANILYRPACLSWFPWHTQ